MKPDTPTHTDEEALETQNKELVPRQSRVPPPFRLPDCNGINVQEISIAQLQEHYDCGRLTIVDYTRFCLDAIQKANPYLRFVIETNPDALSIAERLDAQRRDGTDRGSLHGIPILLKDNIATTDRTATCAGSLALVGSRPMQEAHIVTLLRQAGAVLLGKTNMCEWAGMRSSVISTGYSARGGQCRNPYDLGRSASGSSSGSAVSVATSIVPVAIGTETDCSIIGPAMVTGIVGLKPTVALTSRSGVIPISSTQDIAGPFGRSVADVAVVMDVIAGQDSKDKFTQVDGWQVPAGGFVRCLVDRTALKGARFGVPRNRFWDLAPRRQRVVVEEVFDLMRQAGAELYDVEMPCAEERIAQDGEWDWHRYGDTHPEKSEITVMKVQAYNGINEYLSTLSPTSTQVHTLEDVVAFNTAHDALEGGTPHTHPAFESGQDLFDACCAQRGVEDETYHHALRWTRAQCRENGIDAALKHRDLTTGQVIELDGLLFCDIKLAGVNIAAQAGYPIITVPAGIDPDGMPVSITLQHTAWREDLLVKWASAIEDLLRYENGLRAGKGRSLGRVLPGFRDWKAANVPVKPSYWYPGAPGWDTGTGEATSTARDAQVLEHEKENEN